MGRRCCKRAAHSFLTSALTAPEDERNGEHKTKAGAAASFGRRLFAAGSFKARHWRACAACESRRPKPRRIDPVLVFAGGRPSAQNFKVQVRVSDERVRVCARSSGVAHCPDVLSLCNVAPHIHKPLTKVRVKRRLSAVVSNDDHVAVPVELAARRAHDHRAGSHCSHGLAYRRAEIDPGMQVGSRKPQPLSRGHAGAARVEWWRGHASTAPPVPRVVERGGAACGLHVSDHLPVTREQWRHVHGYQIRSH